jgi:YYY domain-containing protein
MREALTWYIVVQVVGLAAWPLAARGLALLDDRGWAVSKTAGLLAMAWLTWLVCMLTPVPFTRVTLLLAVVLIGILGWAPLIRGPGIDETIAWLRQRWVLLLTWELVFVAAFMLFAILRSRDPAVAGTEKPMDMAFLNGFVSAQQLPTQDTWLAGFGEPYYYFGYFVLACLAKLSGTDAGPAYNLAVATVPALATVGLAGLAWNLGRAAAVPPPWAAAGSAIATLLALFCGNLSTFFDVLYARGVVAADAGSTLGINHFAENITRGQWPPAGAWWFFASRVIPNLKPDGINEFPFFSAVWADLHPHFMALPFEVLVLSVATVHVISRGETLRSLPTQALAALSLGGLLVINTWDIAPFWLLYVGLSLYAAWWTPWRGRWAAALGMPFVGALLYAPYFVGYKGPPLGLSMVNEGTPLASMLVLFGWAIALLAAFGLFARWCVGDRRGWMVAGGGVVLGLTLAFIGWPSLGLLIALLATLVPWPGSLRNLEPATALVLCVAAFAVTMLAGVEVLFLDDVFHSRMNTVFKFHENAWLLAGLAAGVGVAIVGRFALRARWIVLAIAGVVLVGGLVFPASMISSRLSERPPSGPTLDGLAFLSPDDRAAVRWLAAQNTVPGRVVIAEAVGDEYSSAARMATYSGAAGVLGWAGHELQWRGPIADLSARQADLASLYRDAPVENIRSLLNKYNVQYVVVGDEERKSYGDGVTTRFDSTLPVAWRSPGTVIYRAK